MMLVPTLRQTYAGLALQGLISRHPGVQWRGDGVTEAELATRALKCADTLVDMESRSAPAPLPRGELKSYLAHEPSTTLHNPDNVTWIQLQACDGWRLLNKDEIKDRRNPGPIFTWLNTKGQWCEDQMCGSDSTLTYRTKLCRADLANLS